MTITVYSKASCVQCNATYKALDKMGLDFSVINVDDDDTARDYIVNHLGYSQVPVVVTDDAHWSGFRPDRLKALATQAA